MTGYANGDRSTLSVMSGIVIDPAGLHLRLQNKGANFVPTSNYPVTTNVRMTGAAADFNGDGFVDLAEGGRDQDNDGQASDTNLSIFISRGADPGNPTRFLFDPAVYINYLAYLSTYEIIALGAGDFNGDGDADIAALSWSGKLWLFTNRFADNHRTPGAAPDFSNVPTLVTNLINDGATEFSYTSEGRAFPLGKQHRVRGHRRRQGPRPDRRDPPALRLEPLRRGRDLRQQRRGHFFPSAPDD